MDYEKLKVINHLLLDLKKCEYSIEELEQDTIDEDEIEILSLLSHDTKYINELANKYKSLLLNKDN